MTVLTPGLHALLSGCSAASVSTQLVKRGFRNTAVRGVRPVNAGLPRMVGPAYTVRYVPAREDLDAYGSGGDPSNKQRQAVEEAPAGCVMVLDCRRDLDVAGMGAILCRRLQVRGLAGVVLDGGVRDTASIYGFDIPVYCGGPAAPANYVGHHAADLQMPVACGGVAVYPGDIVFGDAEAVIVIPAHMVEEVAHEAAEMEERERFLLTEIEAGRSIVGVYPPNPHTMERYQAWRDEAAPRLA
jgi:regulator of RNase E activity RraA